jgi:hypothetical protein
MRKCKSYIEISNNSKSDQQTNTIPNGRIIIEEDDQFMDQPIYIRTDVKSFSYIPHKLSNHTIFINENVEESSKSVENDVFGGTSSTSTDEWNCDPRPPPQPKQNFFAEYLNSTPKTFSGTINNIINNLFENPEGRMTNLQRATIILFSMFEAYRTIISSFLTVFVPQNCGGYSCTILQNIIPKDNLEIVAISINTFMAFYFCALFTIERARETVVKHFLIADKSSPANKEYLVKMLSEMRVNELRKILELNRLYRTFAQVLIFIFFVNAGISCVVIQKNYLNNTTITVFITNTFFMFNRIHKALKITSSGEYNIYSAYRTDNLIYNRYRGEWLQDEISVNL